MDAKKQWGEFEAEIEGLKAKFPIKENLPQWIVYSSLMVESLRNLNQDLTAVAAKSSPPPDGSYSSGSLSGSDYRK